MNNEDTPILPFNLFLQGRSVEDFTLAEIQQMISYSRFSIDRLEKRHGHYNPSDYHISCSQWREYLALLENELELRLLLS